MDKLRVCIGSNDTVNIAKSHMGDTKQFYIYDIFKTGEIKSVNIRINNAVAMDHSASNKMERILKIIEDAEILVAWQKSPNFVNIAKKTKYQPVIVKADKIEDVLIILKNSYLELSEFVNRRRGEKFSGEIPEYS